MTKLFISYSRKDIDFARKLHSALKEINVDAWIDWIEIAPVADWWKQIQKGIETADGFLFLLSPDSITSDICNQEIEHAIKNGKRLIPLVVRDVNPKDVHPGLAKLNWIFFRVQDDFATSLEKLKTGVHTDLAWVEFHTRLQIRAVEWGSGKSSSRLLRGTDLREAEEKLAASGNKDPQPTDLQRQYTLQSRKGASRSRNILLSVGTVVVAALTLLSIFALNQSGLARDNASTAVANQQAAQTARVDAENQRVTAVINEQEAIRQEKISRAGELAAQSIAVRDTNFPLAALLGLESFDVQENFRTKGALLGNLANPLRLKAFLYGHSTRVKAVAFANDQKVLISAGCKTFEPTSQICSKGEIFVWDLAGDVSIRTRFEGHDGWIFAVVYDPKTNTIISAGGDAQILIWTMAGEPVGPALSSHSDAVVSLAFDSNTNFLASADISGHLVIHDMQNHQTIFEYDNEEFDGPIAGLAFSPDGKYLIFSLCGDYRDMQAPKCQVTKVAVLDLTTNKIVGYLENGHTDLIRSLAFSPNGRTIATAGNDGKIVLWDLQAFEAPVGNLTGHQDWIFSLSFIDENTLASSSADDTVIIWNLKNGTQAETLTGHADWINSIAVDPNHTILAAASEDGAISLWDLDEALFGESVAAHRALVSSIAASADQKLLVSGGYDGILTIWDGKEHKKIEEVAAQISEDPIPITSVSISSSGTIASGHPGGIILWDSRSLTMQKVLATSEQSYTARLSFSKDGRYLASSSWFANDTTIMTVWDMSSFEKVFESPVRDTPSLDIAFSPIDNDMLAFGDENNNLVLWKLSTKENIFPPLPGHLDSISSIAFSPDGKTIAAASYQQIILWDVKTGQQLGLPLHSTEIGIGTIESMAFNRDGTLLATNGCGTEDVCTEPQILLWDVESHQILGEIQSGRTLPYWIYPATLSFDADGTTLVTGGCAASDPNGECTEGHLLFWEMDPQAWIKKTCVRAGRNFTKEEWTQYFPGKPYQATCPQWPVEEVSSPIDSVPLTPSLQASEVSSSAQNRVNNSFSLISLAVLCLCCSGGLLAAGAALYYQKSRREKKKPNV
jgi:WD40 repeat protein